MCDCVLLKALALRDLAVPRIAAVGAGGKTTLLKRLAAEYRALGQKPVIITTTHMKIEDASWFLVDPTWEEILTVREREGYVIAGAKASDGKIGGLPSDILEAVLRLPCPVLIEADGARRLPVKIPAKHEPVLLSEVTCVMSVYGLDAVGRKIREVCFRAELAADFLNKDVDSVLRPEDIAALALSEQAGRKGLTEAMQYRIILNKADTKERQALALKIRQEIEKKKGEYGFREVKTIVTLLAGIKVGETNEGID